MANRDGEPPPHSDQVRTGGSNYYNEEDDAGGYAASVQSEPCPRASFEDCGQTAPVRYSMHGGLIRNEQLTQTETENGHPDAATIDYLAMTRRMMDRNHHDGMFLGNPLLGLVNRSRC